MALNAVNETTSEELLDKRELVKKMQKHSSSYRERILWWAVILLSYNHLAAIYGLYMLCFQAKYWTILWCIIGIGIPIMGGTAGAHRLWSHRSYKAKWPLKLILVILQSSTFQGPIFSWARDHRMHHKYTDTDADPHNAKRGYFFTHIGWLLVRKHPEVKAKGFTIDASDLKRDPFVAFQKKYYLFVALPCAFIFPTLIPYWFWNETLWCAWHVNLFRICEMLNVALLINSVGHKWGARRYDKSMSPADNAVMSFFTFGEGNHNYHHVFPWDYRSAEYDNKYKINMTTNFIEFFAFLGLAYDLKIASPNTIKLRAARSGEKN